MSPSDPTTARLHRSSRWQRLLAATGLALLGACGGEVHAHKLGAQVHLTVSPEVREQYRAKHKWNDESVKQWEDGSIRFGTDASTACELHAHGRSSLRFLRKSYSIKLPEAQQVLPGDEMRRFFLLNLAFDEHQFEMRFAHSFLEQFGLFHPTHRLARLFVNGDDEGIYLVCERHANAIRRVHPDTVAILRCAAGGNSLVWDKKGVHGRATMRRLEAAMAMESAEERAQAIEELVDVEQLCTWMAFNSLLRNSDTSGELFLFERRNEDEKVGRFQVMGWDYDDLMSSPSHPEKTMAHPLTWATEVPIEKAVLTTPALLQRYRAALQRMLDEQLPQAAAEARLEELRVTLDELDPAGSQARKKAIAEFAAGIEARRSDLRTALAQD